MRAAAVAFVATVLAAFSVGAATPISPLDFKATLLNRPERMLPKGLRLGPGCLPPIDEACIHIGRGIMYEVEDGDVTIVELSRVRGHFIQPLPYGVTETSSRRDIVDIYARRGVRLGSNPTAPELLESGFITINGGPECWVAFEFGPKDRLVKASLRCLSGSV